MSQRRIRVVEVTRSLNVGGLERVVSLLASGLDPSRFDVSVACLLRKGFFAEELESRGIPVHRVSNGGPRTDYLLFLKLLRFFRRSKPDIVHTHNTHALMDGVVAARLARVPVIVHTDHARRFPDKRRYMLAERVLSRFLTRIVAVSEYSRDQLVKYEKIPADKIDVIYNGVPCPEPVSATGAISKELGLTGRYPILGCVSRLTEQKGVQFVIAALPEIVAAFPRTALLIIGDGTARAWLERRVSDLGLSDHVLFLGMRRDAARLMSAMDVFLLTSLWEGLPLSVLEALAQGKPVIVSAVGGLPEILRDRSCGRLVVPTDIRAIAAAVKEFVADDHVLGLGSRQARDLHREKFSDVTMVSRYQQLFLTCIV